MAERSELVPTSDVTTIVNALKIKKGGNRIAFGDQEDLNKLSDIRNGRSDPEFTHGQTGVRDQDRCFIDGNYSVSMLNYSEKKPVVVIHQENVDPCVMVEKMMHLSTAVLVQSAKGSFFGPSQWFSSRRSWLSSSGKRKKNLGLAWKNSDDLNQMKEIDLTGLLYCVRDHYLDDYQIEITYSSDGVYTLTWKNTKIGIAINLAAIFDAGGGYFNGMLFEDPDSGCFALVVWSSVEVGTLEIGSKDKFILPMSSCLYDNMYRSFHNNGDCIDNPYYGPNGASDFDFTQLPDHIFVNILHRLPLAQRVRSRRVSQRWLSMANTALAMDIKTVDTYKTFYSKMKPDQLQCFLPLVSDCLEELTLGSDVFSEITFSSITAFSSLKDIHFSGYLTFNIEAAMFVVLDRSPKLKVLDTWIPKEFPMPYDTHGPYPVEKLSLWGECSTDSRLVAFLECFPDLTQLMVSTTSIDCFTASCISWVMEKYGPKLYKFELFGGNDDDDDYELQSCPPFGAVTGIQTCSNLRHLLLHDTNLVSDALMGSLAAGCHKLESLNFHCSGDVTNGGLAALATLPNLTKLVINGLSAQPDLSEGVTAIARKGRLIVFEAGYVRLSATCLKTIVRHCQHLKRLEISHNDQIDDG